MLRATAAIAACAAVTVSYCCIRALRSYINWRRDLASRGITVPLESRGGTRVRDGDRLQLSPAEAAMLRISCTMRGSMRVTAAVVLEGAVCEESLRGAVASLAASQPLLRCVMVQSGPEVLLQVVDTTVLPVRMHPVWDDAHRPDAIEAAWLRVWEACIEKAPLELGAPLCRVDAVVGRQQWALLVTVEHAVCDGVSIAQLCHRLLLRLAGGTLPSSSTLAPAFEVACAPKTLFPQRRAAWRRKQIALFPRPTNQVLCVQWRLSN
jgi:hypothetical protein